MTASAQRRAHAVYSPRDRITCLDCGNRQTPRVLGDGTWECRACGFGLTCDECGRAISYDHYHLEGLR